MVSLDCDSSGIDKKTNNTQMFPIDVFLSDNQAESCSICCKCEQSMISCIVLRDELYKTLLEYSSLDSQLGTLSFTF